MTIALQSGVRRKSEEEKKGKYTFSLAKDVYAALYKRSKHTGDSMSRIIETALRELLGMTKQVNPDEGDK